VIFEFIKENAVEGNLERMTSHHYAKDQPEEEESTKPYPVKE
jgi:hypothetical protein